MTDIKRPISLQLNPSEPVLRKTPTSTTVRPHSLSTISTSSKTDSPCKKFRDHQEGICDTPIVDSGCNIRDLLSDKPTTRSACGLDSRGDISRSSSSSNSSVYGSGTSSSSSNSSHSSGGYDSPHSPSLILPHLYVGDQAQTQIDTISNLNIRYILSLQSLPKFLDDSATDDEDGPPIYNIAHEQSRCDQSSSLADGDRDAPVDSKGTLKNVLYDEVEVETISTSDQGVCHDDYDDDVLMDVNRTSSGSKSEIKKQESDNGTASPINIERELDDIDSDDKFRNVVKTKLPSKKDLLPKANTSKDYLVKFKSCVHKLIKGKCINISDTFETLVDKFFDETHNFIEEARKNHCNILVHCKAGISRSPTIAIAYLMKWKRLHLHDAYEFVKRCRPQISPNLNFMGQLMNYERRLLQKDCNIIPPLLPSPLTSCLPRTSKSLSSSAAAAGEFDKSQINDLFSIKDKDNSDDESHAAHIIIASPSTGLDYAIEIRDWKVSHDQLMDAIQDTNQHQNHDQRKQTISNEFLQASTSAGSTD